MSKSVNRGLVGNLNPQRKKSTNYSQLVIRKQVLAFLNEHKKSQLVAQLYEETIEAVTSYQSPVTSNGQFTVTHNQSQVNNCCVTAKSEDERTILVTGDWRLVTEFKDKPMSLEDVVKNLSSKRIEQLFIVYLEKPTRKLWRWSLTFLGVILGLCLFTSLSALRF